MNEQDVVARLRAVKIVPVIVIDDPDAAVPLARALAAGGLSCVEVTFRTPRAAEALERIASEAPELLVGAGTVLNPEQAKRARAAGAQFIVAPGFNPRMVEYCLDQQIPVYPGVCTPSEIEQALERGLSVVKFFPAEPAGGLAYLKAIAAPYPDLRFIPTGGISAANVASYLAYDRVVACGGSWMAPSDWIAQGQFTRITEEASRAALRGSTMRVGA
jgi:2-dehydro-3-deoxyphosphogluconate aldolase/(4S)-4-hydroxy-2-oxoglutarate aldolase